MHYSKCTCHHPPENCCHEGVNLVCKTHKPVPYYRCYGLVSVQLCIHRYHSIRCKCDDRTDKTTFFHPTMVKLRCDLTRFICCSRWCRDTAGAIGMQTNTQKATVYAETVFVFTVVAAFDIGHFIPVFTVNNTLKSSPPPPPYGIHATLRICFLLYVPSGT